MVAWNAPTKRSDAEWAVISQVDHLKWRIVNHFNTPRQAYDYTDIYNSLHMAVRHVDDLNKTEKMEE